MSSLSFTSDGDVPLESVIASNELTRRQCRQPDHEAVNRALVTLAQQMANSPRDLLQKLADTALALCQAHSSGISLLEEENGRDIFRWHAVAGQYAPHLWGTTPRNFSPCGTVLDTDAVQLMSHLDRHFRYLADVSPRIVEALLVPFHLGGQPVGTIWVISHDETRQFDAEDARVLKMLGEFAAAAYQIVSSLNDLKVGRLNLEAVNCELKRKVAEIDAANSDLQNLLNGTEIATIFLDTELNIRSFTAAAGGMFRLIGSDVGRPITDLAAQFTDVDLVQDVREVLATLSPRERQVSGVGGRHYQKRILPYRSVHNVIAGVVLTFVEVTHLKHAEQLAKEAQAYAESVIDTVREPLVVLDANLRVKSASKAFFDTFGGATEDTLSKSLYELGDHQWDIPDLRTLLAEVLFESKKVEDYEVEHELPKLGRRTMLLNARRLQHGDGKDPLLLLAIADITDRKLAADAVREGERRLHEIVEALPTALYTTDAEGRITMFNQAAVEFSGRVPEIGSDSWCVSWKMYSPDGAPLPHDQCPMAIALKENRPIRGSEATAERPDGTRLNFVAYPTPLYDDSGKVTGAVNMLVDITERKQIEQERLEFLAKERAFAAEQSLQEARAELAHVTRALTVGELATSIAHEVNQPLAAIVTNAEACLHWLSGETPNLHEARESLALIVRDGNRGSEVIHRIREFLKKDGQQMAPLDINEVVREAVALASAELLKSQVAVRVELSTELPPVRGDRIQLQQVILNLIMNGREAMASVADRPRGLAVISQNSDSGGVLVTVRDSGAGTNPQEMDRMFDAFFTTKPKGMGMGLSISRSIIEAHGGHIWAAPNDGPGLTVQFTLPAEGEIPL